MKFYQITNQAKRGFSLIELMVAMGILSVLMLMMTVLLDQIQQSWRYSADRIGQFREARVAFDIMTKNIGQASMNTYYDLKDVDDDNVPDEYVKTSELHFKTMDALDIGGTTQANLTGHAIFFQAPLGFSTRFRNLNNLFNGRGYFVAHGSDERFRPKFVNSDPVYRYRLMEFRPPAESNQVFEDGIEERENDAEQEFTKWFGQKMSVGDGDFEEFLNPLAENIVTLVIAPRDTIETADGNRKETYSEIAPNYFFDSNTIEKKYSQQVPPLVRLTMVAIDETNAVQLQAQAGDGFPNEIVTALNGLFVRTADYEADVLKLVDALNQESINHKVFSSLVMLRSAKWSAFDDTGAP